MKFINFIFISLLTLGFGDLRGQTELSKTLHKAKNLYETEDFEAALESYGQALKEDKTNYEAAMGFADSQHKLSLFMEAITSYNKAQKLKEDDPKLYFNRAAASIFIQDYN